MIEADFQDRLVDFFRTKHVFVKPLVASALMAGMPDLFVRSKYGVQFSLENKVWRNKTSPLAPACLIKLLDGEQKVTIVTELWRYNAFCPIVAFVETKPDLCHWTDGRTLHCDVPWRDLATKLANLKYAIQG